MTRASVLVSSFIDSINRICKGGLMKRVIDKYLADENAKKLLPGKFNHEEYKGSQFNNIYVVNTLHDYVFFINYLLCDYYPSYKDKKTGETLKEKIFYRNKYFFRGFSDLTQLEPTILRSSANKHLEYQYISKFEENASLTIGQFNNPIDLVAAAEHFGGKTRLLDWSTSPYVATLFALYNQFDDESKYYGLAFRSYEFSFLLKNLPLGENAGESMSSKYCSMMTRLDNLLKDIAVLGPKLVKSLSYSNLDTFDEIVSSLRGVEKDVVDKVIKYSRQIVLNTNPGIDENVISKKVVGIVKGIINPKREIFLETNYSNERLFNQRGLFQICFDDYDPFYNNNVLLINPKARKEIIKYINRVGFNYYMLMNDPVNAADTINRTLIDQISFDSRIDYELPKKPKVLVIMGCSNSGKSTIIRDAIPKLLNSKGLQIKHIMRKSKANDVRYIATINDKKVGFNSSGDTTGFLARGYEKLKERGCEYFVLCAHTTKRFGEWLDNTLGKGNWLSIFKKQEVDDSHDDEFAKEVYKQLVKLIN